MEEYKDSPDTERPISLISVVVKCLNMLVKDALVEKVETLKIIPPKSFAYRRQRSATMCLNEALHLIANKKQNKEKVFLCLLDFSDAYNCVDLDILYQLLLQHNISHNIANWIKNFLSSRKLTLGGHTLEIKNGLPQGSCLSPVLFNIYTSKLH